MWTVKEPVMNQFRFSVIFCLLSIFLNDLDAASIMKLKSLRNIAVKDGNPSVNNDGIIIDTSKAVHITTDHFLSIAIDSDTIRWNWRGFDFR